MLLVYPRQENVRVTCVYLSTYVRSSLKHIERSPLIIVLAHGILANSDALESSISNTSVLDVH